MPLHVYEGQSGKLITTILRPGKRPSGKEIVSYLKRIVKMIRSSWPDVSVLYSVGILITALRKFTIGV